MGLQSYKKIGTNRRFTCTGIYIKRHIDGARVVYVCCGKAWVRVTKKELLLVVDQYIDWHFEGHTAGGGLWIEDIYQFI